MTDHVILLHGIWMRGFTLAPLARRLREAGFASIETLDYASVGTALEDAVERLAARVRAFSQETVHIVGHSLGGMLAVEMALRTEHMPVGRIVCLGSPLRGSSAARGVDRLPLARLIMGHSADILMSGFARWDGRCELGVIAGRTPLGLGRFVGTLDGPHDGTVSVAETMLPGITDHCVVPASHSGLVFSDEVGQRVATFLRSGRFSPVGGKTREFHVLQAAHLIKSARSLSSDKPAYGRSIPAQSDSCRRVATGRCALMSA